MEQLSQEECIKILEEVRWQGIPRCPYCQSRRSSAIPKELRYHCNDCFTSYSVKVGTIFHKTRLEQKKWFHAILLYSEEADQLSSRKLAKAIGVSRNTAASILKKIRECPPKEKKFLNRLSNKLNLFLEGRSDGN